MVRVRVGDSWLRVWVDRCGERLGILDICMFASGGWWTDTPSMKPAKRKGAASNTEVHVP